LQAEPNNIYDANAIKVSNAQLDQVGYIKKSEAEILVDLLTYMTVMMTSPSDVGDYTAICTITITAGADAKERIFQILRNGDVKLPFMDIATGTKYNGYDVAKSKNKSRKKATTL